MGNRDRKEQRGKVFGSSQHSSSCLSFSFSVSHSDTISPLPPFFSHSLTLTLFLFSLSPHFGSFSPSILPYTISLSLSSIPMSFLSTQHPPFSFSSSLFFVSQLSLSLANTPSHFYFISLSVNPFLPTGQFMAPN